MQMKAETRHLIEKHLKRALHPVEILGTALLSVLTFAVVYKCRCSSLRYSDSGLATLGVVGFCALSALVIIIAFRQYRQHRACRSWIALAICMPACFAAAMWLGDRYWWRHLMSVYTWEDMPSYVNIDPESDRGQSFMDAGTVYFKEDSYVLKSHAIAFRNGRTYCVAPIVRASNATHPQTINGFALPRSGTVDFWAVGTDCCGASGNTFDCGDANSVLARSGLRALDELSRPMYLLGVQEWSATTGLPVRHPLFFEWVKDPVIYPEELVIQSDNVFVVRLLHCFFFALIGSFVIHLLLQRFLVN